ncbi:hypothetical protein CKO28_01310 [Rhodovibrio sodomensis]|uniref:Uncharacterized protein n=1 Tax=Rhodovibrio sodomensis TaxID=1088 RepID=A0ABS1D9P0_9PROT|nr:hypothetical protein [Rhodovibrio sodomensis]MBK1666682.1 hypothetical protein [Rhodovibrio sodomensis]
MKIYVNGELVVERENHEEAWNALVDMHHTEQVFGFLYEAVDDAGDPVPFPAWVGEDLNK